MVDSFSIRNGTAENKTVDKPPGYVYHVPYFSRKGSPTKFKGFQAFLTSLVEAVKKDRPSSDLYFVNPLAIEREEWRSQNRKYAACWEWETGELVQLTEKPKSKTNTEAPHAKFLKQISALPGVGSGLENISGEPPPKAPLIVHLLRQSEDFPKLFPNRPWCSPVHAFLGTGGCLLYLVASEELFFKLSKALTTPKLPGMVRSLDFRVPTFSLEDFESASREQLEEWFALFLLYVVEMPHKEGLLIASPLDIEHIFEELWPALLSSQEVDGQGG